jgi:hypothetical protein
MSSQSSPLGDKVNINRRRLNRSSETTYDEAAQSPSFQHDMLVSLALEDKLEAESHSPKDNLRRLLSIRSVVSSTSSFASRMQAAQDQGVYGYFRKIGAGTCGAVYEEVGTPKIIKVAHSGKDEKLQNDYYQHSLICDAMKEAQIADLHVPQVHWHINPGEGPKWWELHADKLPKEVKRDKSPMILCAERILPLPRKIRENIIDIWCPEDQRTSAKMEPTNSDCLVRVYLGRRRNKDRQAPPRLFTLRNFNLWLDQVQELNDLAEYNEVAQNMGKAMATLHWRVGVDGEDVEFVLGSAPTIQMESMSGKENRERFEKTQSKVMPSSWEQVTKYNFKRRAVQLWMLDFDRCNEITPDEAGIQLAVRAFYKNDPYFPRPLCETTDEQCLWDSFKLGYLEAAQNAITRTMKTKTPWKGQLIGADLPQRFIDACLAEGRVRAEAKKISEKRAAKGNYEDEEIKLVAETLE